MGSSLTGWSFSGTPPPPNSFPGALRRRRAGPDRRSPQSPQVPQTRLHAGPVGLGREVVFDEAVLHARLVAGGQEGGEVEGSGAHIVHAAVGPVVLQVQEAHAAGQAADRVQGVLAAPGQPVDVQLEADEGRVRPGDQAVEGKGSVGVGGELEVVVVVGDAEALGGRPAGEGVQAGDHRLPVALVGHDEGQDDPAAAEVAGHGQDGVGLLGHVVQAGVHGGAVEADVAQVGAQVGEVHGQGGGELHGVVADLADAAQRPLGVGGEGLAQGVELQAVGGHQRAPSRRRSAAWFAVRADRAM
uniref:Uncharacterized protein n=1 Tax=uncultured bacterium CBNPD1 BAC clone 1664 TaxID=417310 RepID=B1N6M5_9BACT|nr:hypothetical protein [uncultured bacterium CBNPD1 BAC clone 1664]